MNIYIQGTQQSGLPKTGICGIQDTRQIGGGGAATLQLLEGPAGQTSSLYLQP